MGGADGRWAGSRWPLVGGAVAGPPKNLTQDTFLLKMQKKTYIQLRPPPYFWDYRGRFGGGLSYGDLE